MVFCQKCLKAEGQLEDPTLVDTTTNTNIPFSHPKFKNPSTWNPLGPLFLEMMCFQNETYLERAKITRTPKQNLKKAEVAALHSLKNNAY